MSYYEHVFLDSLNRSKKVMRPKRESYEGFKVTLFSNSVRFKITGQRPTKFIILRFPTPNKTPTKDIGVLIEERINTLELISYEKHAWGDVVAEQIKELLKKEASLIKGEFSNGILISDRSNENDKRVKIRVTREDHN